MRRCRMSRWSPLRRQQASRISSTAPSCTSPTNALAEKCTTVVLHRLQAAVARPNDRPAPDNAHREVKQPTAQASRAAAGSDVERVDHIQVANGAVLQRAEFGRMEAAAQSQWSATMPPPRTLLARSP